MDELEDTLDKSEDQGIPIEELPPGILRLREEWHREGRSITEGRKPENEAQVIFSESSDGTPVGDYILTEEDVRGRLRLSQQAFERLIACGELDSILIRTSLGIRRLISVSCVERFESESAMITEPEMTIANTVAEAVDALRQEVDLLKTANAKQLQQVKDMVLLELRNLKEQDRDLTSYIFELTQQIEEILPKRKKRR